MDLRGKNNKIINFFFCVQSLSRVWVAGRSTDSLPAAVQSTSKGKAGGSVAKGCHFGRFGARGDGVVAESIA